MIGPGQFFSIMALASHGVPAASAIRGLIERIVFTPDEKPGEMDPTLHGDLGTIPEWTAAGSARNGTDIPRCGMSVSVVAGARCAHVRFAPRNAAVPEAVFPSQACGDSR